MFAAVYPDGMVCISILVSHTDIVRILHPLTLHMKHPPGEDQYGYEDSGERWLPVHTVESIVSIRHLRAWSCLNGSLSCSFSA